MKIRFLSITCGLTAICMFSAPSKAQLYATQAYANSGAPEGYVIDRINIFRSTCSVRSDFTDGSFILGSGSLANNGWSVLTAEHLTNPADGRTLQSVQFGWGPTTSAFHTVITAPASGGNPPATIPSFFRNRVMDDASCDRSECVEAPRVQPSC